MYIYGHEAAGETYIVSMNLSTGALADVIRGSPSIFDFSSGRQSGGIVNDGTDLFVYFRGATFQVNLDGDITAAAGDVDTRSTIEFEGGYDPKASHPADEVQLANRGQFSTAGVDKKRAARAALF